MNPLALKKALAYILTLLVLVATFVFCVGLLPIVQTAVFPSPPLGGWLIKPIYAILFAAAAVTTCLLAPFLLWPIRRMLRDAGYQPKPIKLHVMIVGIVYFCIYTVGMGFYFTCWTTIEASGVQTRALWMRRSYGFQQIRRLERIPPGYRSESLKKNGPYYQIKMDDDRWITFGDGNAGLSDDQALDIAGFLSEHSQMNWATRPDARPR